MAGAQLSGSVAQSKRIHHVRREWFTYLVLTLAGIVMLFPFLWMILTSFKSMAEVNLAPPTLIPREWYPSNYLDAWFKPESTFGRYFLNSLLISVVGTALQLLVCVPAAYAFATMEFPGRGVLFIVLLATTMIPAEVTLIPNFVTIRHIPLVGGNDLFGAGGKGLYDSYAGIMVPYLANPFSIFLLRQQFRTVPRDYWEAAQLDGTGRLGYLWHVLTPLSIATLITVVLFGLLSRWNALLWPLLVTSSEGLRPVQVGLLYFRGEEGSRFHTLMAAATFTALPGILLYFSAQKRIVDGLASGIKG
ncbi:MAG: carbohydrate ABC transporter permease [Oscillochloris sp.]|nr:carbohydrate ABC transporter permease [Oscillochloris sp.]